MILRRRTFCYTLNRPCCFARSRTPNLSARRIRTQCGLHPTPNSKSKSAFSEAIYSRFDPIVWKHFPSLHSYFDNTKLFLNCWCHTFSHRFTVTFTICWFFTHLKIHWSFSTIMFQDRIFVTGCPWTRQILSRFVSQSLNLQAIGVLLF